MQMRSVMLLALGLLCGVWSQDSARAQTSAKPPVSIVPPGLGVPALAPNPAADYDGFSVGSTDDDTPSPATPPVRSRAPKGSKSNADTAGQSPLDQEDEALRRKLTICKDCK